MNPATNPTLSDLRDIHLPAPVSWWPPAPGWWLLAALIVLLALGLFIWRRLHARNHWRRYALAELASLRAQHASQTASPSGLIRELSVLLRRVVISRFPREDAAALSGEAWLGFLDRTLGDKAEFRSPAGQLLSVGPYARDTSVDAQSVSTLFDLCERWLKALPGEREMISFEWPWLFLALPLPLLLRYALPAAQVAEEAALRVPSLDPFGIEGISRLGKLRARHWRLWLAALAWLLLVTASARPEWIGDAVELPVSGRELMLAVDLSGSMQTEDFVINGKQVMRLDAVKSIAGDFIARRVGDRIGLILFGSQAYVQTPLTFDRTTVNTLLQESAIGLAGDSTAIGDAIGLATKRLRANPQGNKVLILLTDGASNAGEVEPLKAAELAAKEGLTIYTIGIGAETMNVETVFGTQRVKVPSDLDEKTLKGIADATGGRYFRARDAAQLNEIYDTVNKLQPVNQEKESFRPRQTLFFWPLSFAALLAALILLLKAVWK